jgi:hypothetical protein
VPDHLLKEAAVKHALKFTLVGLALAGCGTILHSGVPASDVSTDYEPPSDWEAGIQFSFADSAWKGEPSVGPLRYGAEVRFHDGRRQRVVTGRELFYSASSTIQTPWYRLWLLAGDREIDPVLYVTIGDQAGNETIAEYPLRVRRDGFYSVRFAVYTPGPDEGRRWSQWNTTSRAYDVPAGAKRVATDSLRIGYHSAPRDCFNCPM